MCIMNPPFHKGNRIMLRIQSEPGLDVCSAGPKFSERRTERENVDEMPACLDTRVKFFFCLPLHESFSMYNQMVVLAAPGPTSSCYSIPDSRGSHTGVSIRYYFIFRAGNPLVVHVIIPPGRPGDHRSVSPAPVAVGDSRLAAAAMTRREIFSPRVSVQADQLCAS